jgi:urease accessory protein
VDNPRSGPGTSDGDIAASIALVRCLQLSDSALPIGRYAHSLGLEALLNQEPTLDSDQLLEVVQSFVSQGAARLDGVAIAEAHRLQARGDLTALLALDHALTVRKLAPAARLASQRCGHQLAALAGSLAHDPVLDSYCEAVRSGKTDGNLAVVEGTLAAALGVPRAWAVLIELRGCAASLLSAAVRLGRLPATRAQEMLRETEIVIAEACRDALSRSLNEMCSSAIELETYAMRHERADSRLFMT